MSDFQWKSESIELISDALVDAQEEMEDAVAAARNPHFGSSYADLASIRRTIRPTLAKHGLAVTQCVIPSARPPNPQCLGNLRTTLIHSSGQWLAGEQPIVADWSNPQKVGSATTYARRYGLQAIVGIASEDDDGNAAAPPPVRQDRRPEVRPQPNPVRASKPEKPTPRTGTELYVLLGRVPDSEELEEWITDTFVGQGYPKVIAEWTNSQVAAALPQIREHIVKLAKIRKTLANAAK